MSEIPEVYTNSVQLAASIYEFLFCFRLKSPEVTGEETTRELLRVRMSPQHALALYLLLGKYLNLYQDRFQEIRLPDDLTDRLLALDQPDDEAANASEAGWEEAE